MIYISHTPASPLFTVPGQVSRKLLGGREVVFFAKYRFFRTKHFRKEAVAPNPLALVGLYPRLHYRIQWDLGAALSIWVFEYLPGRGIFSVAKGKLHIWTN